MFVELVPYKIGDNVLVFKKKFFGVFGISKDGVLGKVVKEQTFEDEDCASMPFAVQKLTILLISGALIETWVGEPPLFQKYQINKAS